MPHYPNLRAHVFCPLCRDYKEDGLLMCWPCGRANKRWLGDEWPPAIQAIINLTEIELESNQ